MAEFERSIRSDGSAVVRVVGEVDLSESRTFREFLLHAIEECNAVELDLAELTFIDSTGVGLMVLGWRAASQKGVALTVTNPSERIRRLFRIKGLETVFHIGRNEPPTSVRDPDEISLM